MASYLSLKKMKRKELEEVSDDFSDFSLSSPARKIRRLDAELPPIMEEEEQDVPLEFEPSLPEMQFESIQEKVDGVPFNAERAIVLFKPVNSPLMPSSSKYSVSVDSDFIFGFKNQFPWSGQSNNLRKLKLGEEDEAANAEERDDGGRRRKECLAVVPWVAPSHVPQASGVMEMEGEATSMDMEMEVEVEVNNLNTEQQQEEDELGGGTKGGSSESFHQWQQQQQQQQQQHCMTPPQLPQNMSTPITWFRTTCLF